MYKMYPLLSLIHLFTIRYMYSPVNSEHKGFGVPNNFPFANNYVLILIEELNN